MAARLWRGHHGIGTALRCLVFLALLHRLNCLACLVACAPVLLLTACLLGVVLMHSDMPPLEDADRHLYKKVRRHNDRVIISSSDESLSSSSSDDQEDHMMEEEHLVVAEQEEEEEEEDMVGKEAVVAWTADDERSIRSIGSLELERDARLEKLMSRRSSLQRNLIDLDVHIPARNLTALDIKGDPGSAPSSLMMLRQHSNPFFHDDDVQRAKEEQQLLTRHESFTAAPLNRPSRFRPYFVTAATNVLVDPCIIDSSNSNSNSKKSSSSSSSSSSSASSDHQKQQQQLQVKAEEESSSSRNNWDGNRIAMAVDVELISDSSDDDMSLPGGVSMTREHSSDDDEENSFEVASITQQVAAAGTLLAAPAPAPTPPPAPREESHQQHRKQQEEAQPEPQLPPMVSGPSPSGHQHQHQHQQEDGHEGACLPPMEKEREVSEIREHPAVPVVVDSSPSSPDAGRAGAGAGTRARAGAGTETGAPSGGKSSIKFKAPSKKAVFGFFKK